MVIFYSYVSLPEGKWNDTGILNTAHGDIPLTSPLPAGIFGSGWEFSGNETAGWTVIYHVEWWLNWGYHGITENVKCGIPC